MIATMSDPIVYDGNDIVAHACVYFISTELDCFIRGSLKHAINRIRRLWKDFLILHSFECGTPVALGTHDLVSERVPTRNASLTHMIREIEKRAQRPCASECCCFEISMTMN